MTLISRVGLGLVLLLVLGETTLVAGMSPVARVGPEIPSTTAIFPLVCYLVLCLVTRRKQRLTIPDRRHSVLDSRMTANLTLVGLSFTVIGLLVTLFQSNLLKVYQPIFLFSLSLACFFASYILLYLRLRILFDTLSVGLTNYGLWAIMAGLRSLFIAFNELRSISVLFTILLLILALYIIYDVKKGWETRNQEGSGKPRQSMLDAYVE